MLLVFVAVGCGRLGCAAKPEAVAVEKKAPEPTVTLRFRPLDKLGYRENWVYDVAVPGSGIGRNALTLDVALLAKLDHDSFAVRETVRSHRLMENKKVVPGPSLAGAVFTYAWGRDHSLVSEIAAEAPTPELTVAAKTVAQLARFGTLIEYPDQAVAANDTWSIEPRQLMLVPGLEATLRPTYTLESIENRGGVRTATIATDMQVDVVPLPLSEGITIEGGGTASGTLRVRVSDGVLLEARSVMHFSQEITMQGNEILGYREFSATAHVFTTAGGGTTTEPDLSNEPYTIEEPEHDHDCDLSVASAIERVRSVPTPRHMDPLPVLRSMVLPSAAGGAPLHDAGENLLLFADPKRVELAGQAVDPKELGRALRERLREGPHVVYVYADASLPVERMRAMLLLMPARSEARLVIRDANRPLAAPKALRSLDEHLLRASVAATRDEREKRVNELVMAHLALCEPALAAFTRALTDDQAWASAPTTVLAKFIDCGCTATNLDGLEASLEAAFGTPDLRWLALAHVFDDKLSARANVSLGELTKLLVSAAEKH